MAAAPTIMSALSLLAFFALAALDWYAVAGENRRLEWIAKPAALAALLVYAAASPHASTWLIAALVLSLLGDVYLMLPDDLFAVGLGAFLLAHLAYIADFDASAGPRIFWWLVLVGFSYPISSRILRAVGDPVLRGAVVLYIAVISFMVGSAFAAGEWAAIFGALLFFTSDGIIAWSRFVQPYPWARIAIIVTYHIGQLGLVSALRS
jgi:uncharacterized membrane protein YhhN